MKDKILVVEDTPDIKVLIKGTFKDLYDITFCKDGSETLTAIDKEKFDVILLDLMLPDISGFELASIFKDHPNTEEAFIVVISSKEDIASKITAYGLGAVNYIEKPFDIRLLRSAVKSLLSIKNKRKESSIDLADIHIDLLEQTVTLKEKKIKLTKSEYKILCYLLQRKSQVCSREKILSILDPGMSDKTDRIIDSHVSSLRKKLSTSMISIASVYGEGYSITIEDCE